MAEWRPNELTWVDYLARDVALAYDPADHIADVRGTAAVRAICSEFLERFPEVEPDNPATDEELHAATVLCRTILAELDWQAEGGGEC